MSGDRGQVALLIAMKDRVYGVKSFPMKYDKTGKLVRKFCPELAKFPDKVSDFILTSYPTSENSHIIQSTSTRRI